MTCGRRVGVCFWAALPKFFVERGSFSCIATLLIIGRIDRAEIDGNYGGGRRLGGGREFGESEMAKAGGGIYLLMA